MKWKIALDPEKLKEMDELIAQVYADYDPSTDPTLQRQPHMMPMDPSTPMSTFLEDVLDCNGTRVFSKTHFCEMNSAWHASTGTSHGWASLESAANSPLRFDDETPSRTTTASPRMDTAPWIPSATQYARLHRSWCTHARACDVERFWVWRHKYIQFDVAQSIDPFS